MLNLANEKLVEEGFKNLAMQIQQLVMIEREDIKNLTYNFIALKEQLDAEIKLRKVQETELFNLKEKKVQAQELFSMMKEFDNFKSSIIETFKGTSNQEIKETKKTTIEESNEEIKKVPFELHPKIEEIKEKYFGHCLTCNKEQEMVNYEIVPSAENKRMARGDCSFCGRKLFKIL